MPDALSRTLEVLESHPTLRQLAATQLEVWPEHEAFLARRFGDAGAHELAVLDRIAAWVRDGIEDLPRACAGYRSMCAEILDEELFFRRHGRYRRSTLAEAIRDVYSNEAYMERYMHGVLLSQLWWSNHSRSMLLMRDSFLAGHAPRYRHLEVGPGHGLLLCLAAADPRCREATGWDASEASLRLAGTVIERNGLSARVSLERIDVLASPRERRFDSIVISEVLEHLEDPAATLERLRACLSDGGRIFINVPITGFPQDSRCDQQPEHRPDTSMR